MSAGSVGRLARSPLSPPPVSVFLVGFAFLAIESGSQVATGNRFQLAPHRADERMTDLAEMGDGVIAQSGQFPQRHRHDVTLVAVLQLQTVSGIGSNGEFDCVRSRSWS